MHEQALFIAALQLDREKRAAYLDQVCGHDAALRQRVELLLEAHERAGTFMQQPAAGEFTEAYRPVNEGPGTVIGPYKLLQQIGEGGFGVVYMAEQQEPVRRKVALKIIKPGMDTKEVVARFESERQALALMDHPNVARVFDAGATESGRPYFVMELVHGVPITEFCDKNHLSAAGRLELFNDVCRAVQHAHQKGIIHRDLKPSNILVTLHDGKPVPKVIDFGVAKATSQQFTQRTLFTAYGQMVGTPAYMSPEQAEMSGLDIDTRSDIYSLGVLLYELLTGTTPLEGKQLREAGYAEMQRLIRELEPPRPSTRLSSLRGKATIHAGNRGTDVKHLAQLLRGDLDWIVMKALEKDRNRRYETPSAFAADVERFLRNEAILARPPSVVYQLRKFARRNRAAVVMAATVALLLIVGITGTSLGLVWARNAEDDARRDAQRAREAEQQTAQGLLDVKRERDAAKKARADVEIAAAQGDSRRLAAESSAIRPTNPGLALLLAIAGARKSPARSAPHNNALLAALRDCREERTLFAPPFETPEGRTGRTQFLALCLTPDGTRAVAAGSRSNDPGSDFHIAEDKTDGAYVYDLQTGQVAVTLKLPGVWFSTMALSPDGRLLAAVPNRTIVTRYTDGQTVAYTQRAVRLWDIRTGKEVRVLAGHTDRIVSLCFDAKGERLVTASWDKTARIWDVASGKTLHVLADSKTSLELAELSPDGRRVLTLSGTQVKKSEDVVTAPGRLARKGIPLQLEKLLIDPPARPDAPIDWIEPLASTSTTFIDNTIAPRLWDALSGKQLATLTTARADNGSWEPYACGFSPDSVRVVTRYFGTIALWNAADGKHVLDKPLTPGSLDQLLEDGDRRLHLARDPKSPQLLIWQTDREQQVWRRSGGAVSGHSGDRYGEHPLWLAASSDGPPLLAQSAGDAASIRALADNRELAVLRGHDEEVSAAAFLSGSKKLLTASPDGTLRLWNLEPNHDPVVVIRRTREPAVGYARFLPGGQQVLTAPASEAVLDHFTGKDVSLWEANTGKLVSNLVEESSLATSDAHKALLGELRDLDIRADGERLVTVHMDSNPRTDPNKKPAASPLYTPVRVWDLRLGKRLCVLEGLRRKVASARFSPDGHRILTLSDERYEFSIVDEGIALRDDKPDSLKLWTAVDLWDAETGKHLRSLVPETIGWGDFALWSPDGKRVLTNALCHRDKVAADVFDPDTGERLCRLKSDGFRIDQAAFSPNGKLVLGMRLGIHALINDEQHRVDVWDVETGAHRVSLRGHTGDVLWAQFSPDSRSILTTSTDGTARIWDVATGEARRILRGHRHVVRSGQFSPDGKWVVTASTDGTARVWSAETGQEWLTLPLVQGEFTSASVEFSPDSQRILTASIDGVARIWPVDPLPLAIARQPRELTAEERVRFQVD